MTTNTELPAGPALDAEIARRVFGYVARRRDIHPLYGVPEDYVTVYVEVGAEPGPSYPDGRIVGMVYADGESTLPRYSTDIAAAWEVVEALRGRGYCFEVGCNTDRAKSGYESTFWEPYEKGKRVRMWEAEAETAPEAICRAALKALAATR